MGLFKKTKQADMISGLAPDVIRLLIKIARFSKGGLSLDERREIGGDLLALALSVLEEVVEAEVETDEG
jgi:hypothetical protein